MSGFVPQPDLQDNDRQSLRNGIIYLIHGGAQKPRPTLESAMAGHRDPALH